MSKFEGKESLPKTLEETTLELRRISDRSKIIIEALPNGIIIVDQEGRITLCNAETERLFGYTRQELDGKEIELLVPERFRPNHPNHRNAFFASPQIRAMGAGRNLFGRRKDGSEFPIEIGLNPLQTDEGTFVLASIVDITERKAAEAILCAVVESTPNAVVIIEEHGYITLVNSQTEQLFGYTRAELMGQQIETLVPERYRAQHPQFREHFFREPKSRPMGAGRDLFGLRKDGTEVPVEIGLKPLDIDGRRHVLAAVVDITERIQIETNLLQKNQEMEQFIYTVSHDLKAPLVTSMSFIQFIREDLPGNNQEHLLDSLSRLERANKRMAQLIDDLLRLSRIGRLELILERINITNLARDIWHDLSDKIDKNIRVHIDIQNDMPEIIADKVRLRQVFENLLTNAIKYGCTAPEVVIQVGCKTGEKEICYFVKDNGPGIAPEYHHKIFGLFERLETNKEGTGVGLAIVSRVAQLHNGHAWVESDIGKGATFWVSFPLACLFCEGTRNERSGPK